MHRQISLNASIQNDAPFNLAKQQACMHPIVEAVTFIQQRRITGWWRTACRLYLDYMQTYGGSSEETEFSDINSEAVRIAKHAIGLRTACDYF